LDRDQSRQVEPPHTRLPHVLATLYGLAIVYASLEPFSPWLAPAQGTPFFLFAPSSVRWTRYDAVLNVLAYAPFGFFVALLSRGASPARRIGASLAIGAAMSFAMESLQMYIPPRIASPYDLATNTLGALLGGVVAALVARNPAARAALYGARTTLFLPGQLGDVGLGLLALWLVAQMNPGIPLFAVTFDAGVAPPGFPSTPPDSAGAFVQAAGSAFQVLGVGLFATLLLRRRRNVGAIVLAMIVGALVLKGFAAAVMLKPATWQAWIRPAAMIGIAVGAALLRIAIALPRPVQVALCAIALLSSLGAPVLAPETLAGRAPVALFDWHYGQLLNYNDLTRMALVVWPVLTAMWLFVLAGRPAWGRPDNP